MEGSGITPVMDINHGGYGYGYGDGLGFGGNGLWLFAILALMWGGNGFFGNNGYGLGYRPATAEDVNNGFNFSELQQETRDILGAVSNGTAQAVAATNQAKYDNINVAKDIQMALTTQIGDVKVGVADILAKQNECCCTTLRAIDASNANTTAQVQKILDAINTNEIQRLRDKVGALELAQAVNGVVRYPSSTTYNSGCNPFCGCGCNGNI